MNIYVFNANQSITNGETIQNNEFLGQVTTNYQDNPAVAEAIATNGQFKINKPTYTNHTPPMNPPTSCPIYDTADE
jgi:hypothetical protein